MRNSSALLALTALDCRDAWHKLAALADPADADSLRRVIDAIRRARFRDSW
jgi:hypothetical protein